MFDFLPKPLFWQPVTTLLYWLLPQPLIADNAGLLHDCKKCQGHSCVCICLCMCSSMCACVCPLCLCFKAVFQRNRHKYTHTHTPTHPPPPHTHTHTQAEGMEAVGLGTLRGRGGASHLRPQPAHLNTSTTLPPAARPSENVEYGLN